jgi:type IV pilus assembly protein PilB
MAAKSNIHIGQLLIFKGIITREQLSIALNEQKRTKEFICNLLIKLGFANEEDVYPVLGEQLDVEYVKLREIRIEDSHLLELVPQKLARYYKVMPLKIEDNRLVMATSNPADIRLIGDLSKLVDMEVKPVLAAEADILEAICRWYGKDGAADASKNEREISPENIISSDPLVTKVINNIVALGIEQHAADIHTESFQDELKVHFKIRSSHYEISIKKKNTL